MPSAVVIPAGLAAAATTLPIIVGRTVGHGKVSADG
jgi:hypothetical protein